MKSVELIREPRSVFTVRGMFLGLATLLLGVAVSVAGCSKDTATESFPPSDSGEASGCCVTLCFSSDGPLHAGRGASASYGSGAAVPGSVPDTVWGAGSSTRGVVNPSIVDEWAVYDLWVLQYDMSGGAAGSLAARRYVTSVVQDGSSVRITADLEPMEKARLVVLANVPGMFTESELPTGSTLADLAALTFPINSTSGSGLPEDYSPALPMRGDSGEDLKLEMGQTAVVCIPLYRLVSKVNFTVDNLCSEGWPRVTLTDISLRNVPASGSYGLVTASTHASTRYPAAASGNFKNYDGIADGLGAQCEMLWYLAPNSRGTGSGTTPADKTAVNAPSGGDYCTYAYVQGMMQMEGDAPLIPMSYRVYLGANSYNDYNVWANEAYRVKLTIRAPYWIEDAVVLPAGDIPALGGTYSLTLTGTLPPAGVEVRAQSGGTVLGKGKVTASGAAVSLAVPANASYSSRTVTFEYLWNGTWTKIGDRTQAGYSVTAATHNAPATIPGQGGSYNVTLTGLLPAAGVEVRAQSGGTALVTGKVTASGTAVSLTIPGQLSYNTRTVTFEYNWNGTWTKIGSDCTQQGWNVTAASVTPAGDIPGAGGTYTVTLTGWGGYKIRAISGSTELVVKNDYEEVPNYSASIVIPANTGTAARNVTFQYSQAGVWKDIETRSQAVNLKGSTRMTYVDCEARCAGLGGLPGSKEEMIAKNWDGWNPGEAYWTTLWYDDNATYDCFMPVYPTSHSFQKPSTPCSCRCRNE